MYIDLNQLPTLQAYFTMTQTLVPRPIAWTLTENEDGRYNLAPFSYFIPVSSNPPMVMLSLGKKPDGSPKDTRVNIEQRKDFVVHIAHQEMLDALNQSSATLDLGVSEVDQLQLETTTFEGSRLPRLKDSRIAYACQLEEIKEIGNEPQALIFGRVIQVYLDDAIISHDAKGKLKVHADRLQPLSRLGASEYASFGEILSLKRPA